jgi:hypothetical protein
MDDKIDTGNESPGGFDWQAWECESAYEASGVIKRAKAAGLLAFSRTLDGLVCAFVGWPVGVDPMRKRVILYGNGVK